MSRPEPPPDLYVVEPLSEREREILALLAENRSNQEVANLLHLALSTVKWYLRQMFGKLGVDNRRAAVERGRILGLLKGEDSHTPPHHLPAPTTPFIGREAEVTELLHLLAEPLPRLVTLVGPGGSGKTRLAVQVASVLAQQQHCPFQDGIWFVPLESVPEPESMLQAIASAVGVVFFDREQEPRQQLVDYFRRRQALLVLDNFEHLLAPPPPSALLISELLTQAPGVKMLVTSRIRLNAQGEQLFAVGGMHTPAIGRIATADLAGYGALQLFLHCARRLQPAFEPDEENLLAMAQICQAVEGMPLGIELAAAWIEMLSPHEILVEIEKGLDFLRADWADVPERHHSLRRVFDASWKLLTRAEQAVVMALSVFQGSFSREAAQQVSGAAPETLRALVHKSWLTHQTDGRFHIHPLLRQYADEKLQADQQAWEDARSAHARCFATLYQKLGEQMKGAQQVEAFERAALEFENIRAAWHWLVEQGQTGVLVEQVLLALVLFCTARWRGKELFALIRKAQGKPMDQQRNTKAAIHQAILMTAELLFDGYGESAVRLLKLETSTSLSRFLPEARLKHTWNALSGEPASDLDGYWWVMTAVLYSWRIDAQQGVQRLLSLQDYLARQQQPWLLALANQYLGDLFNDYPALQVAVVSGAQRASPEARTPTPQDWLLEANVIFESLGDRLEQARTLSVLGSSLREENPKAAILTYQAVLELFKTVGPDPYATNVLLELAFTCLEQGRTAEGFEYFRQMQKMGEQMGNRIVVAHALSWQSIEAVRYSDLGHARKTRDENLLIFQEYRNEYYAWGLWESGEIERVAGEVEAAQRRFESARQLFAQLGTHEGFIFYHRGQGDLAQARGDYETARREFQTSLEIAQEVHHDWAAAYALCGLGRAALGLGQPDTAHEYFLMGLRTSQLIRALGLAPVALAGLAAWYAATGKHEEAVELSSVVIHYGVAWNETKNYARWVIETTAGELPPNVVEAAKGRGKIATYETVVSRLLEG